MFTANPKDNDTTGTNDTFSNNTGFNDTVTNSTTTKGHQRSHDSQARQITRSTTENPSRRYHIGTATQMDRDRLRSKASLRTLETLEGIEKRKVIGSEDGGGCCARDRDEADEYERYCRLSRMEGDITPPCSMELGRERWVISKMSKEQRGNLARVGDRRYLLAGSSQLMWDKSGLERDKILKAASELLGDGTETLSKVEYDSIVRSRIATGGEDSMFLPAPPELTPEQEAFVMEKWSQEESRACRNAAHTARCAFTCLDWDPERAETWFRGGDTTKNRIMKSEFDRLTAEATTETLGVAKEVEARATAKMTEDDRSNDSTETFPTSSLVTAGDDLRLYKEPIQLIDAGNRQISPSSPDPDTSPPRSRKSRSIFERTRRWLFGRPQPSSFPEKGGNM